jgi:hypothetical protein
MYLGTTLLFQITLSVSEGKPQPVPALTLGVIYALKLMF